MGVVSIKNFTRQEMPRFAYDTLAARRLPDWDISLVFVGADRARALNRTLRGKTYVPNVLSYRVGRKSGEIIICPQKARAEATAYDHSYATHILYLFIHGILHLEGRRHGATMTRWEDTLLATFAKRKVYGSTNRSRHRHRDFADQTRRRRRGHR